jgi:two-component system sensor histidine kinase and response regulator WspE
MSEIDLSQCSMLDLFREEVDGQRQTLTNGLLALERHPGTADQLESCMRAAHSMKGAARIVGFGAAVGVAHAMEDCLVAAQHGRISLHKALIDRLFEGVDLLVRIANTAEADAGPWADPDAPPARAFKAALAADLAGDAAPPVAAATAPTRPPPDLAGSAVPPMGAVAAATMAASAAPVAEVPAPPPTPSPAAPDESTDRVLRVTAQHLNRLLGLSGESLVESRWLTPFAVSLRRLKQWQGEVAKLLEGVHDALPGDARHERAELALAEARRRFGACQQFLVQRLVELDMFDRRAAGIAHRLYDEALACRMRPFGDGAHAFPRMIRDLAHDLGKQVRFELRGEATPVDRDVLDKLEAPLTHLLRNALDHGIESPEQRRAAGKPAEAVLRLEAGHSAGMLQVTVADDGRGVDLERVRRTVVERGLIDAATAARLHEAELLDFLFLPGFTVKDTVTEISGRGVGLDAVQNMVKQLRGKVRVASLPGQGARFQLQLPLTVSFVRTLLVEIGGEPYAFPLTYITRAQLVPQASIELLEGRQHVEFAGQRIGLVAAQQLFQCGTPVPHGPLLPVVVIGEAADCYGLVVDRFLGVRELIVQPLDPRLGKLKDISAGAILEDGTPLLIVDVEDLLRSVEKLVSIGHMEALHCDDPQGPRKSRQRVLVVDDSLTVRELERKLIESGGYEVEVAVDGADGWNAVRAGRFNLVVTDIDMPRMDGIELVSLIKRDPRLKTLPVMIVSYKDREEDRRRGLDAGADFYLTKGSFQDASLLQAVADLIGEAVA